MGSREIPQKKNGPNRFSRFGVYWIPINRQAKYIYRDLIKCLDFE